MPTKRPDDEIKAIRFGGGEGAALEWMEAQAAGDGKPALKRFTMTAYTGGPMMLAGFYSPVVVDLAGVNVANQSRPIFMGHDETKIVGHTDKIDVSTQRIKATGYVSGVGSDAQEVQSLAANGFPWQASIGASIDQRDYIPAGESTKVNGRNLQGPLIVARKSTLKEVSFVPLGADDNTTAAIAAVRVKEDGRMTEFQQWLHAKKIESESLSAEVEATLQESFDAEVKAKTALEAAEADRKAKEAETQEKANTVDIKAQIRKDAAEEETRIFKIRELRAKHPSPEADKIIAKAIADGDDIRDAELAVLRASRANLPAIHSKGGASLEPKVLEAALAKTLGLKNIEKDFKPEVLEASDRDYRRGMGLHQLFITAAAANGYHARAGEGIHAGNIRDVLTYACGPAIKADGFSTLSLPNILENLANKTLLQGYMEMDQTWREIATVRSVPDFKSMKFYRLLDSLEYEQIGDAGEIKHGKVSEETYSGSANTYARMFALTRQTIINDDMGALDDLRTRLGRGAAKKFNNVFWTAFINNSSFFTAGNTNYTSGSTTNLGTDGVGLALGVLTFRKMTSPSADGTKRVGLGMTPTKLLVPPELEANSEILYRNTNLGYVAGSAANIYANKYRPIVQNRLSDSTYTGYSTTSWYMFGDEMNPMAVLFLNGQEAPTVESAQADFDTLGMVFRGYHDFNAIQSEYLSGIRVKGAA